MMRGKFTENATGIVVDVQSVFAWEPHEQVLIVTYPSGRAYGLPVSTFEQLFTMCPNQTLIANSFGAVDDRPTPAQREEQAEWQQSTSR